MNLSQNLSFDFAQEINFGLVYEIMEMPLVILHGWGASAKSYDKLKPLLEQKGISVFVFDLPGFGSEPAPKNPWAVDDYADWVLSYIEKKNLEKFYLFGYSFGGRIAIKIAARRPEGLRSLILCAAGGLTPREKIKRKTKILVFGFLSKIAKAVFSLPILKLFYGHLRKLGYFLAGSRDYYLLQNEIMRETFKRVVAENLESFLGEIKAPTLIVWGKNDKTTSLSDAYLAHKRIAGSKLEILGGVGHSPHLECPERLSEIIEKFLISLRKLE